MHNRVILLAKPSKMSIEKNNVKQDIVSKVVRFMEKYCMENPKCINPLCDYWTIGGRWTGFFTLAKLDKTKLAEFRQECMDKNLIPIPFDDNFERNRQKVEMVFKRYFPDFKGEMPVFRSPYNIYDDDIVPLKDVYDIVVEEYGKWKEEAMRSISPSVEEDEKKHALILLLGELYQSYKEQLIEELKDPAKAKFDFYTRVFNIETNNAVIPDEPKEIEKYWAIVIDYHF